MNDVSELEAGKGILSPLFWQTTHEMVRNNEPVVGKFLARGLDIFDEARQFEQRIIGYTFSKLCAYLTCFCRSRREEDFKHGLLSQWRGYGEDGGYALQFSKSKLRKAIKKANKSGKVC